MHDPTNCEHLEYAFMLCWGDIGILYAYHLVPGFVTEDLDFPQPIVLHKWLLGFLCFIRLSMIGDTKIM